MFGRPPTGAAFTLGAIYIFRWGDGLVRELWQEADLLGLQRGPTTATTPSARVTGPPRRS
jgi:hypothetical protein